ncbi:uncharacterized protein RJT20DRAFT_129047 [Scheffersomyces xylosifermentans]|uniref:uncharacterized protein n=1 Tax=Scheffersomyces xylosifermentans TaxID=1304137 RepID=UPI00315D7B63
MSMVQLQSSSQVHLPRSPKDNDYSPIMTESDEDNSKVMKSMIRTSYEFESDNRHSSTELIPNSSSNANNLAINNTPSTPTSFKGSRSDASEMTNDTTPSSFDDQLNIQLNDQAIPQARGIQPIIGSPPVEESSKVEVSRSRSIHYEQDVDPLHPSVSKISYEVINKRASVVSAVPSNRILNNVINESTSAYSSSSRRHTSPNTPGFPDPIELSSRHSFQVSSLRPPITRNTFPSYRSSTDVFGSKPDSTNSEILRMRNSILVKRNMKKKRKEFLEDEKVLVGNKISEGHENFVMAYNMLTGIRVAVSRCSGVMKKLDDNDFKTTKKLSFSMDGSELTPSSKYDFKFKDYCPEVFRELRTLFGLDPADYLVSITGKYILSELGSPGKSGSFFYYSRDYRFIIKTIHHSEHKQLRRILKDYYEHVKENPNTLISQFYGLHRVKMPFSKNGSRKVHFVVMNNLFPPHRDIHRKYDLKGSTWGRITKIDQKEGKDLSQFTLKDINFLENHEAINFGPNKRKLFFAQLESDVALLKKINVMDYSLLLGVHDVKKGNTFDLAQKLSVFDPKSSNKSILIKTNPRDIDRDNDLPSNVFPGRSKYVFYGHDGGIRATNEDNDPIGEIYYLGIIDCLTNYSTKKRLETFWRSLGHPRSTISALPASEYGDRFLKFIKDGTHVYKKKIS